MVIHVVQHGDTINSIAELYGVSATRLSSENEILTPNDLVLGQTIVITFPEQTYIVQEGDTLISIANAHGVTLLQLLRNNPYLSDREFIYPGEELAIRYTYKGRKISTNGFANEFINRNTLRKTLPSLTYLSIIGYMLTDDAEIIDIDDSELIEMAKAYNVAPLMLLSSLTVQGLENIEAAYNILGSEELMDRLIENILNILVTKGYYGLIITYQVLNTENLQSHELFNTKIVNRLKSEGFPVFIILSQNRIFLADRIIFERVDYTELGQEADIVTLLNYNWGFNLGPPAPVASIQNAREFLDYVVTQISQEKIDIGITIIGYDWSIPYVIGVTRATSLTLDSALTLASQVDAIIRFDEISQTPYFEYIEYRSGIPISHIVWFIDARSIDATVTLIREYGLRGKGIWNIMRYFPQMWLVINSQFEIEKF